ncbi:MAG: YggS family pyridoxal phosphate-dependent enzyme [Magnetococcales bacterium]|nr:YggS family pyridoxal phosphate-dependent enzyme [Magnetococcales bacterium]
MNDVSDEIAHNLRIIQARMQAACRRCGRDPHQVKLLAVSKTQPAAVVQAAVAAGQLFFGENRVLEARDKQDALPALGATMQWHLIGPLQRNKARMAAGLFQMIHSVDSLALAEALASHHDGASSLPVLMQVNIGREAQKRGVMAEEATALARSMALLPGIALCGLMAIPPQTATAEAARPYFQALAALARQIDAQAIAGITMRELSMGMSHDFEVAIEEGATWVRVGSALFGERLAAPGDLPSTNKGDNHV